MQRLSSFFRLETLQKIPDKKYRIPLNFPTLPLAEYRKILTFTQSGAIYYIEAHNILYSPPRYTILPRTT